MYFSSNPLLDQLADARRDLQRCRETGCCPPKRTARSQTQKASRCHRRAAEEHASQSRLRTNRRSPAAAASVSVFGDASSTSDELIRGASQS